MTEQPTEVDEYDDAMLLAQLRELAVGHSLPDAHASSGRAVISGSTLSLRHMRPITEESRGRRVRRPSFSANRSWMTNSQPTQVPQLEPLSLRFAIGSSNRAKVESVRMVVSKLFPDFHLELVGIAVPSNVSDQPMSDQECMEGALNRAKAALKADGRADFAIGLEGGVQKIADRWFESGWICVVNRDGRIGWGSSGRFELSGKVMKRLLAGDELATVIDDLAGEQDLRQTQGAMGNWHCFNL